MTERALAIVKESEGILLGSGPDVNHSSPQQPRMRACY